jgi:hypothetical protein
MPYAHNLIPADPPIWLTLSGVDYPFDSLTDAQRATQGWLPLLSDIPVSEAPFGYAAPVLSTDGLSAMQRALGTADERAYALAAASWPAAARWRKVRAAQRLIDDPNSTIDQKFAALRQLAGV